MKTNEIKQREKTRIQYYLFCPICNQEIVGNSPRTVEAGIQTHMRFKHAEEEIKKEKKENASI
jgi:predicted small metal-binding protein